MSLAKKHEYEAKKKGLIRDVNCPVCQGTGKYWHKKWRRFATHNKCFMVIPTKHNLTNDESDKGAT